MGQELTLHLFPQPRIVRTDLPVDKLVLMEKVFKGIQVPLTVNLVSRRQEADIVERNLPSVSVVELYHHTSWLPFIRRAT